MGRNSSTPAATTMRHLMSGADRVAAWAGGDDAPSGRFACGERCRKIPARDVYVYFDNDMKVRAPFDAKSLRERVQRRLDLQATV
jgi:uncharacterized protein YecE (DUF72 family)